jgi:preprotein translocase subunit SecY
VINLIKQLSGPTNKDLRKRIYYTLFALLVFSIGTAIVRIGAKNLTSELSFWQLASLNTGGSIKPHSIFGLGVMPYISASIIMQLLQSDIVPYFKDLKEQGYVGRQKLNVITRYMGIFFAFLQGYAFSMYFMKDASPDMIVKSTVVLTAGTAFLLWLGDQITKKGIGNGISLIIMAGILNTMPGMFITVFKELITNTGASLGGILGFSGFVLIYLIIIVGIIWVQLAERRIPIQYSNRTTSAYGAQQSYLPIKLNSAGVVPVIFASSILSFPGLIAGFLNNKGFTEFVEKYLTYTEPVGLAIYVLLIIIFGYFYTIMQMKPDEMAKNLNQNGGYIPGIRPGNDTEDFITKILNRLSIFGTLFIIIIAVIPIIFSKFSNLPTSVTIGGTGLLIVVGIAIETYKQLESSIVSRSYKTKRRSRR